MSAILAFLANLKGYRTLVVNAVVLGAGMLVGFGVLHVAAPSADTVGSNFDAIAGWLTSGVAALNMVLRLFTTTPLGVSDSSAAP